MKSRFTLAAFLVTTLLVFSNVHAGRVAALFSPQDKPTNHLIELIDNARHSIHAAVYMLTDKTIVEALINAKERKVDVKIIVDVISTDEKFGKANVLKQNNVDVFVFDAKIKPPKYKQHADKKDDKFFFNGPIMHNKFAIIDGVRLWTGSFNWTGSANNQNCENVIITDDRAVCKQYEEYFSTLLTTRCKAHSVPDDKNKHVSTLHDTVIQALEASPNEAALLAKLTYLMQQHTPATPAQ